MNVPGCPVQPDNFMETLTWLLYHAAGAAPPPPLDELLRPQWIFGRTVHEGCDRAGYYEQGDFAKDYNSPKCQVKIGCWGPVVNCNVPKRGWMGGIGGCPNVGGICIGCTMPGFPDKFMPFMDMPPGASLSSLVVKALRRVHPPHARHHQHRAEHGAEVAAQQGSPDQRLRPALPALIRADPDHGRTPSMTATEQAPTDQRKPSQIVEMAWDPITRIIGNLGIYTKIDFANRVVTECHSTSSLFRGYSVFMKGKDPRDAGFITSRICGICGDNHTVCSVYAQNMAYGIKSPKMAEKIINLGEAAEYMFDHTIFQDNLVFVDFCEAMVKQTNPSVLARAENTAGPAGRRARLPHDRRHHAGVQPVRRRVLPAGAEGLPGHAGDVLPDGGPPRPPVDGLSRRGRHDARADAVHRLPQPADRHPGLRQEGRRA